MSPWLRRVTQEMTGPNILLGAWLLVSPWLFGFAGMRGPAAWSSWILGAAAAVIGLAAIRLTSPIEQLSTLALGIILALSPAVLAFAGQAAPSVNAELAGLVAIAFGVYTARRDGTFIEWRHNRRGGAF